MDERESAVGTADGLSPEEAARRLEQYGPNTVTVERRLPVWRRALRQFRDPLIVVLLVAAVLTVVAGDLADTVVILFVVVVNTTVGVVQEVRAEHAVAALKALSAPAARVVRDGTERHVPAAEVVPGDVVLLAEGDIVPADGVVLDAALLLVDESALTGESVPVDKAPQQRTPDGGTEQGAEGEGREQTPGGGEGGGEGEARGAVSAGTVVVRGRGRIEVTATGARSATGRIASLLGAEQGLTPLQRRLAGFGRLLAAGVIALCLAVLALGLLRGQSLELMAVTAISLAVAAVPESLPAVVTLALALGARRMAARNAIIRRLPAVETLGSVTVLATDKTGTLTEGRMVAERLWTPAGAADVTGSGYAPDDGRVLRDDTPVTPQDAPDLARLLRAAMLCNDAGLQAPDGDVPEWSALGDPTEAALLTAGARLGLDHGALGRKLPRVDELPFDSDRKRMTTVHRGPDSGRYLVCKGAPEAMLRPSVLSDPHDLLARAALRAEGLAREGYRVLAVAEAERPESPGDPESWETRLSLLGLVGILDPPRAQAAATMAACRRAGIAPVLITGDHPLTAGAVAARLGIADEDAEVAIGGRVREDGSDGLTGAQVYARTGPEQKLDIIQAWRSAGHVVAMTGDGVNDGPALHQADIGVAMGQRGTEVARQAADLVLADDDLGTVVAAVEEGRRVYDNVRRFLLYGLAGGAAEILVMLIGPFFGLTVPLLPAQILWINLLTHGLPGVALGAEPADRDVMRRPPRPPEQSVLGAGLWPRILLLGTIVAAVSLGVGIWAHETGRPWQTMLFLVLGATQLGVALGSRTRPGTWTNPFLLAAVAAALALQIAGVLLPPLRSLLDTEPLGIGDLAIACAVSVIGYAAMRLQNRLRTRPPREVPAGPGLVPEQ